MKGEPHVGSWSNLNTLLNCLPKFRLNCKIAIDIGKYGRVISFPENPKDPKTPVINNIFKCH